MNGSGFVLSSSEASSYCGPPFGPCQNFHSSKSSSKPSDSNRNYFLSEKLTFFSFKKQVLDCLNFSQYQRGDHIQWILWSPPLVHVRIFTPQNLAPNCPILIKTISFQKNLHFFHLKNKFWIVWILVNTKGGTTFNTYCGPPFGPCQNFHSSKSCSKPSDSNRNYFLSEKLTFFSFKKQVLDCLNFSRYLREDHIQCILWSPLCPCQNFYSSKSCSKPSYSNRNYFLSEKLTFFSSKKQVLDCLNFSQY